MNRSFFVVNNLSKKFKIDKSSFYALKNINLIFPSSGLVSITGKSGSGKSTFLNLIAGIEKPSSGTIKINGIDITKLSDRKFSEYHLSDISIIFQHYNLFLGCSGIENVTLPLLMRGYSKNESYKKADALFERFKMSELKNNKVKYLSGGEKQRVAIMRSLITNPKILLCDEPTGALDSKNSILIMNILKEISESKLVILVSHNIDLVNAYSDRIITFKDGSINDDKTLIENVTNFTISKEHIHYSSKWTNLFLKNNLRKNKNKIILSFITFIIGFTSIFLAFGFSSGSKESQKKALETNLSLAYSTVSETTYFKIENSPLSYEKNVRPSVNLIDEKTKDFKSLYCEENISYFFSNYPQGKYRNDLIDGFEMIPLLNISEENYRSQLLISGTLPSETLEEVIVNKEFVDLLNESYDKIVNKEFIISFSTTINEPTYDDNDPFIKDTFSYSLNLKIVGVVNEFSFLNSPKIYYSYNAAKDYLKKNISEPISKLRNKKTSYFDLINEAEDDNIVSSYSSILFLTSLEEKESYFSFIKKLSDTKDTLQITSNAYEVESSYISFIDSFSSALFVFVIIAFIGINFIIGMISLSNFIQNKKESAIMTCLGARNKSLLSIYLSENYLVSTITFIISIFTSILMQKLLNKLIFNKFSLANVINIPFKTYLNTPCGLMIIIFLVSILSITLFTLLPIFIYRKISIADELRDE